MARKELKMMEKVEFRVEVDIIPFFEN